MKKAKRFVSLLLVAVMTLYLLAGCGDKNSKTEKAQVNYPVPTDAEAVVDAASGLAVNYYLAGRAYLDTFINYDVSGLTEDNYAQYTALVDNAVKAFENANKVNAVLNEALDVYEKDGMICMMPVTVYPKKYVDELHGEIAQLKESIKAGKQPVFDNIDSLFDKLEEN